MTMVGGRSCQINRQKSTTVLGRGPKCKYTDLCVVQSRLIIVTVNLMELSAGHNDYLSASFTVKVRQVLMHIIHRLAVAVHVVMAS